MPQMFIFITIVSLYAIAMVTACTVTPMPTTGNSEAPTVTSCELEVAPLRQVYNGLRIVQTMIQKKLLQGGAPPAPAFELGQQAICTMFYFYLQFTTALLNIPPDSAIYGNYTGNQFAVWSVMQSACQWVQAKAESATLLKNCTLSEISNMCLNFHLYQMVIDGLFGDTDTYIRDEEFVPPPLSANIWINANLRRQNLHSSAVEPILEIYGCTLTSQGTYRCRND